MPTVGIVGGGQLARMTQQAAIALGVELKVLAEAPGVSASRVVREAPVGDYRDLDTLRRFVEGCDVVTFDHEHVPTEHLRALVAAGVPCRPGPDALLYAQDKAAMRERLDVFGVPCPPHQVLTDADQLAKLVREWDGRPLVLKTSRGGYDGKGVWMVDDPKAALANDAPELTEPFRAGVPVLVEERVDFVRELSALVVRSPSGQAVVYPIVESAQENGICREVIAPAPDLAEDRALAAQRIALDIAGQIDVVGVLAVELFETADGQILVNELAMRPHNTGHWTIDGAVTSQFENHLRAVLDYPLGSPQPRAPVTVMANVLGGDYPDLHKAFRHCMARDPGLRIHLYGKEVRPGRKVGHVTAYGDDLAVVRERARHAAAYLTGEIDE